MKMLLRPESSDYPAALRRCSDNGQSIDDHSAGQPRCTRQHIARLLLLGALTRRRNPQDLRSCTNTTRHRRDDHRRFSVANGKGVSGPVVAGHGTCCRLPSAGTQPHANAEKLAEPARRRTHANPLFFQRQHPSPNRSHSNSAQRTHRRARRPHPHRPRGTGRQNRDAMQGRARSRQAGLCPGLTRQRPPYRTRCHSYIG